MTALNLSGRLRDLNADEQKQLLGEEPKAAPPKPRSPLDDDEEVEAPGVGKDDKDDKDDEDR